MGSIMECLRKTTEGILLSVRVIPRASKNAIQGLHGDALKIRLAAPPVEGKANATLIKFLSKTLKLPRAQIDIKSGETGRNKSICITDVDLKTIEEVLAPWKL
jgi:uncharacterized protein (TIGR00251 family)